MVRFMHQSHTCTRIKISIQVHQKPLIKMLKCENNSGDIPSSSMWAVIGGITIFTRRIGFCATHIHITVPGLYPHLGFEAAPGRLLIIQ